MAAPWGSWCGPEPHGLDHEMPDFSLPGKRASPTTRSPRISGTGFGVAPHADALAALDRRSSRGCSR